MAAPTHVAAPRNTSCCPLTPAPIGPPRPEPRPLPGPSAPFGPPLCGSGALIGCRCQGRDAAAGGGRGLPAPGGRDPGTLAALQRRPPGPAPAPRPPAVPSQPGGDGPRPQPPGSGRGRALLPGSRGAREGRGRPFLRAPHAAPAHELLHERVPQLRVAGLRGGATAALPGRRGAGPGRRGAAHPGREHQGGAEVGDRTPHEEGLTPWCRLGGPPFCPQAPRGCPCPRRTREGPGALHTGEVIYLFIRVARCR